MRILVTGGAGYLGSVLVPALLRQGYRVTVLDTFAAGNPVFADWCYSPKLEIIRGDARDPSTIRPLAANADVIIPLAALVGAPLCDRDPLGADSTNTGSVLSALGCIPYGHPVIFPATDSGYGSGVSGVADEDSPLNPVSRYARTKHEAEMAVLGNGGISLRLASVFGMAPQMRLDLMVNDFTWRAVTDHACIVFEGHFRRNFVHVRDVASAFLHAITHYDAMKGLPYNVGNSECRMTKLELCGSIAKHVPGFRYMTDEVRADPDRRDCIVSNERIEATGWQARVSVDEGIYELVKGYSMIDDGRWRNG